MLETCFSYNPHLVPKKRFRGQRSYYRRIERKAKEFVLDPTDQHWFELWHYHADWPGYGNLGWRHRKSHIEVLCLVYATLARQLDELNLPYQLWIYLDGVDAGQDAVYLHSPNPNRDNFPWKFTGTNHGFAETESFFATRLAPISIRVMSVTREEKQNFIAYSPDYGIAPE